MLDARVRSTTGARAGISEGGSEMTGLLEDTKGMLRKVCSSTRREFLRRAAMLGIIGPAMMALDRTFGRAVLGTAKAGAGQAIPRKGGTLTIAIGADAANLSPHFGDDTGSEAIRNVLYDNLVAFDEKMNLVPQLATSWEPADRGKTWAFKLRPGVKFHDNTPLNAQAVKENFDVLLSPSHLETAAKLDLSFIESIDVVDDLTVKFNLKMPYGPFLRYLAFSPGAIASPTALKKYGGDFDTHPVGAGPYKLVEWKKGQSINFERFDDYWHGKPMLDRIIYNILPNASARTIALQTGSVGVAWQVNLNEVSLLAKDRETQVIRTTSARTVFFWINGSKKPFSDVRVRRALNYAVDKQSIIRFVLKGYGQGPACSPFGPGIFGYAPGVCYDYDPSKTKQLLAEAGYPNGFSMSLWGPQGRYTGDNEIVEAVAGQLEKVGIKTTIRLNGDIASYIGKDIRSPEMDMAFISIISPPGDPSYYARFLASENAGKPFNYSYVKNSEIDTLFAQGLNEVDPTKRRDIYAQIQKIATEQAYFLLIDYEVAVTAAQRNVHGLAVRPTYALIVRDAWKE